MSRNARSNENGRFYEISSHRVNVNGFEDFCEFQLNSSKRNQLGGFDNFDEFSPFSLLYAFLDIPRSKSSLKDRS